LIWSVVSQLLKSGGLVWAPLVACETEMGAMHGCLKWMPARAANRFPRDLKTITARYSTTNHCCTQPRFRRAKYTTLHIYKSHL
jgi:hypothetical protein